MLIFAGDMGALNLDYGRTARTGLPEVVFAERKHVDQTAHALRDLFERTGFALATRIPQNDFPLLLQRFPQAIGNDTARALRLGQLAHSGARVAVLSAGTSDFRVAEETAFCLEAFGHTVIRHDDVGVAGIHRLFECLDAIRECCVVIAIAGMEAALASVVAGLVSSPVVGVPTSVGYGVSAGGRVALDALLASCAPGIAVVNIDNGFGAAALAHKIALTARAH